MGYEIVGFSDFPPGILRDLTISDLSSHTVSEGIAFNVIQAIPTVPTMGTGALALQLVNNDTLNNTEAETLQFIKPKDRSWWLLGIRAFPTGSGGQTSTGKWGPMSIDGIALIVRHNGTPAWTGGQAVDIYGGMNPINAFQYQTMAQLDPTFALPIRDNLSINFFTKTLAAELFIINLYIKIWESQKTTPLPPVLTTVPAQTVDQSWQ